MSYRTTEFVFFTAGRAEGVRVGDTVAVLGTGDAVLARAVVVSASLHSSSARLLGNDVTIDVGQRVRFEAHPPAADADSAAAADSAGALRAAADSAGPRAGHGGGGLRGERLRPPAAPAAPRPAPRFSGGLQLDEMASSVGPTGALTSYQTAGSLYLNAPLLHGVEFRTRVSGRWRSGASGLSTGLDGFHAIPYELQLRFGVARRLGRAPRSAASCRRRPRASATWTGRGSSCGWARSSGSASSEASCRRSRISRSPRPRSAAASTGRSAAGGALAGSLSAAADWSQGARRRTLVASQPTGGSSTTCGSRRPPRWTSARRFR